jgi:restriction endonuclease S subunit
MHLKIKDIADVITGYTFREAIKTVTDTDIFVLQAKDVSTGQNIITTENLTQIAFSGIRTGSFLQNNDIIIVSRGMGAGSFRSAVYNSVGNVIASSSVLILRIRNKDVLPEYVSLYLNSTDGQNKILETVIGSYIKAISRKKLEAEIEIPVPPLDKQKSLVELDKNIKEQEKIYNRKKELKKQIISATIKNLTKK